VFAGSERHRKHPSRKQVANHEAIHLDSVAAKAVPPDCRSATDPNRRCVAHLVGTFIVTGYVHGFILFEVDGVYDGVLDGPHRADAAEVAMHSAQTSPAPPRCRGESFCRDVLTRPRRVHVRAFRSPRRRLERERCTSSQNGLPAPKHSRLCRHIGSSSGLPSRPQREVVPDPARLERAATLTDCGLDAPLPGGCALGGFVPEASRSPIFTLTDSSRRDYG